MSRISLSHSALDKAAAPALRDWLLSEGWDDLFLDLDPQRGIVAGERWERALVEAVSRCEAVVFLVSRAWLASEWCRRELSLALRRNKRIFCALLDDLPADLTRSWQVANLAQGSDHRIFRFSLPDEAETHVTMSAGGLARLKAGLEKAGLADIEAGSGRDALPLLAFTMGRLWHQHGGKGALRLDDYRALGGIGGAVNAAVERAFARADADPSVRPPSAWPSRRPTSRPAPRC